MLAGKSGAGDRRLGWDWGGNSGRAGPARNESGGLSVQNRFVLK